jgi:hypothetical protein
VFLGRHNVLFQIAAEDSFLHVQFDYSLLPDFLSHHIRFLLITPQNHVLYFYSCHIDCVLLGKFYPEL